MTISELVQSAPEITLAIKAGQLKEFAEELITKATEAANKAAAEKHDDKLLTTNEVMAIFKVSRTTIHRWKKAGVIHAVRIGGNDNYRMSEINKIMEGEAE